VVGWVKSSDRYSAGRKPNENLHEAVRARWVEPHRQVAPEIVRRAMQSGELRSCLDPDVVLDALYGPSTTAC